MGEGGKRKQSYPIAITRTIRKANSKMSQSEHQRAIQSALQAGDKLLNLFEQLGSKQYRARGVWAAYALARQTLLGHLDDTRLVNRTLAHLRETTRAIVEKQIVAAIRLGEKQAAREIALYDDLTLTDADTDTLIESAMQALDAELDAQLARVRALAMTGVDENLILGEGRDSDGGRTGVLKPSDTVSAAIGWIATAAVAAYGLHVAESMGKGQQDAVKTKWLKQAVAAIDGRTTDCCLRVHGQTVPMDGKFRLTGTPRFADELDGPPFHWNCRTATALVRAEDAGDDLTQRMNEAAQNELDARAAGDTRGYKFPVDAFGGRL